MFYEAIAHNQRLFCLQYMSCHLCAKLDTETFLIAAMYGNVNIFKDCATAKESQNFLNFAHALHLAVENRQYKVVQWFMDSLVMMKNNMHIQNSWLYIYKSANILGTAIASCGDLKMIKMIIEWNESRLNRVYKQFDVDNFVWNGQTAIQTAFLFCSDNFKLLKYLLNKHDPNYKHCILSKMLSDDNDYIEYKTTTRYNYRGEELVIRTKDGLKGSISLKPDCEGYTIADRIQMCTKLNQLSPSQSRQLQQIFLLKMTTLRSQ